jgi:hypothetical protein
MFINLKDSDPNSLLKIVSSKEECEGFSFNLVLDEFSISLERKLLFISK